MSRRGWFLFIALCLIWGMPYLFIRVAVRELPPPALVLLRTAPGGLLLLPFALRRGGLRSVLARWRWVLLYTAAEICVPWLLLSHAEQSITSSMAGLIIAAVPLVGAVLYRAAGPVDHRAAGAADRLDARHLIGLVVGFAGVAALVGIDIGGGEPLAFVEMGVVVLGYSLGALLISRRLAGLPNTGVIAVSLLVSAAVYAPWGISAMPEAISASTIGAVAALALVCTALAFVVFFALIHEVGPVRATVVTYINPLVAVLLGVAFLSEPFTLGIAVGMPLIVIGSLLGTAPSLRPAHATRQADAEPAHDEELAAGPPAP